MDSQSAFEIAQAILIAIGGGGLIVLMLSNYLGKVWAARMMTAEKAKHEKDLALLRSELTQSENRNALNYKEKLDLYRSISEPIVELIVSIEQSTNPKDLIVKFEHQRLSITALLAMFAPMTVYDKYNDMIDYLYNCLDGKESFEFKKFRDIAHKFLTAARVDIGVYTDEVRYLGNR